MRRDSSRIDPFFGSSSGRVEAGVCEGEPLFGCDGGRDVIAKEKKAQS
jgi:hypothetical protein